MADLATKELLDHLRTVYPLNNLSGTDAVIRNPWYIIAAVGFGSSNRPEGVPIVFQSVLAELKLAQAAEGLGADEAHAQQLHLARRVREAILKGGLLCGYSRAINSFIALHQVMPEELRDKKTLRDMSTTMEEYVRNGEKLFRAMYKETADTVQGLLDEIYPDMGWFSNTVGYGITYGATDVLSQVEVSYILVAALIAMDTPRQIGWHLTNAQHGGATREEAAAVRQIAMEVAEKSGIQWRDGVPELA